ncbi:MAG: Flp pilus assembly protein TadB [Labilithrix sp.]|nr:Flp pilus assembly protein TadB [Labilithrix sp.]
MNLMKHGLHTVDLLRWGSLAVITFGLFIATWCMVADETGLPYRYWARYCGSLERRMRSLFIFTPGRLIALTQLGIMFLIMAANLIVEVPMWWAMCMLVAIVPTIYLKGERRKRVIKIEDQLDNFMLALANALKATPSIGAAFNSVVTVIDDPIRSEVDLALKEMKVGSTLDQALLHMAARVGSRQLDSALSSILIGRQVGGNLPKVLETTANTLREMKRLEGVIRTKTADGRMQLWVIGAMPLIFIIGFGVMWPGYFDPLTRDISGYAVIGFVVVSWGSALVLARKVLAVDF